MRATISDRAGDIRVETVPDAVLSQPTDGLVRITLSCICGSDLWPYQELAPPEGGRRMGHEAIGVVEAVGSDVRTVKKGDFVVMPFAFSDGSCDFCHEGLPTSCIHGGFFGYTEGVGGAQAEAIRVPHADGTLCALPVHEDHPWARAFGATGVVRERGEEAVEHVQKLTGCFGVHSVLECVGTEQAMLTAVSIARPGGAVGRVGVPHCGSPPGERSAC